MLKIKNKMLNKCNVFAKSNGGKCKTKIYKNNRSLLSWQCSKGHIWKDCWNNVSRGCWCKKCPHKLQKWNEENVSKFIENKGGILLSKYKKYNTKIKIKCIKHNHIWYTEFRCIRSGTWCKLCSEERRLKSITHSQEFICSIVDGYGGILMSEYKNNVSPITIKCKMCENIWHPQFSSVQMGEWCPECNNNNKKQKLLKDIIKKIFPKSNVYYNYTKFDWLKTEKSRQEIDIFVEEIKLAIEYDGEQHFMPVNFGGCSDETASADFKKRKKLDKRKNKVIKQNAKDVVFFIRIPYTEKITEENILRILKEHCVPFIGEKHVEQESQSIIK